MRGSRHARMQVIVLMMGVVVTPVSVLLAIMEQTVKVRLMNAYQTLVKMEAPVL